MEKISTAEGGGVPAAIINTVVALYEKLGKVDKARDLLSSAVKLSTTSSDDYELSRTLASFYMRHGDMKNAEMVLNEALSKKLEGV